MPTFIVTIPDDTLQEDQPDLFEPAPGPAPEQFDLFEPEDEVEEAP